MITHRQPGTQIRSTMTRAWHAGLVYLALLIALLPASLSAQAIIGKVTDAAGGPLAAVSVSVDGTNLGAVTRDDGTYRIAGVPVGARVVVARRVGYTPQRRNVTVGQGDLTVNVCKQKQVTNVRASTSEIDERLTPATIFSLEQSLDFLVDDELLEVTPKSLRLRKKLLDPNERARAQKERKYAVAAAP